MRAHEFFVFPFFQLIAVRSHLKKGLKIIHDITLFLLTMIAGRIQYSFFVGILVRYLRAFMFSLILPTSSDLTNYKFGR